MLPVYLAAAQHILHISMLLMKKGETNLEWKISNNGRDLYVKIGFYRFKYVTNDAVAFPSLILYKLCASLQVHRELFVAVYWCELVNFTTLNVSYSCVTFGSGRRQLVSHSQGSHSWSRTQTDNQVLICHGLQRNDMLVMDEACRRIACLRSNATKPHVCCSGFS